MTKPQTDPATHSVTTIGQLCDYLTAQGVTFERDGSRVSVEGHLYLPYLTSLPEGVSLSAGVGINLPRLASLPEGANLSADGDLYLPDLTTLPEGVDLSAGGYLYLPGLASLPEGANLSAGGSLHLSSLTSLPGGVSLSAGVYLNLRSMRTLPEGVSLSAGRWIDLPSLISEEQTYQGKRIRLRHMDGFTMRLISKREVGGVTLWRAQYFGGRLDTDPKCYIAQDGDTYAHGDTPTRALRDLRFKLAERDFDADELAATIRERGTVTFNDYRLITGACEAGLRQGLRDRGLDPDTEELPLAQALELCRDGFGGDQFRALFSDMLEAA